MTSRGTLSLSLHLFAFNIPLTSIACLFCKRFLCVLGCFCLILILFQPKLNFILNSENIIYFATKIFSLNTTYTEIERVSHKLLILHFLSEFRTRKIKYIISKDQRVNWFWFLMCTFQTYIIICFIRNSLDIMN